MSNLCQKKYSFIVVKSSPREFTRPLQVTPHATERTPRSTITHGGWCSCRRGISFRGRRSCRWRSIIIHSITMWEVVAGNATVILRHPTSKAYSMVTITAFPIGLVKGTVGTANTLTKLQERGKHQKYHCESQPTWNGSSWPP